MAPNHIQFKQVYQTTSRCNGDLLFGHLCHSYPWLPTHMYWWLQRFILKTDHIRCCCLGCNFQSERSTPVEVDVSQLWLHAKIEQILSLVGRPRRWLQRTLLELATGRPVWTLWLTWMPATTSVAVQSFQCKFTLNLTVLGFIAIVSDTQAKCEVCMTRSGSARVSPV